MDEILQKLLESELLSEEAKADITAQWQQLVEQREVALREEVTLKVRAELAEQWQTERETLTNNIQTFVDKRVDEEVAELKEDIERFRDLEAEYAGKLVEEKSKLAKTLAEELDQLVDKMDAFFEVRLSEEMKELREDLDAAKQNDFGRRVFEAFSTEYSKSFIDEESIQAKLNATQAKLADAEASISKLEEAKSKMIREAKLEKILAPLNGAKREQMTFILANVETARLEEAYNHFIGRVLKDEKANATAAALKESTVVVTGNEQQIVHEQQADTSKKLSHLKKLAGI